MEYCSCCKEEVYREDIAWDDGEYEAYYERCWPKVKERVLARVKRYREIGHTGEDMCGCSMCAARYEIDHE